MLHSESYAFSILQLTTTLSGSDPGGRGGGGGGGGAKGDKAPPPLQDNEMFWESQYRKKMSMHAKHKSDIFEHEESQTSIPETTFLHQN